MTPKEKAEQIYNSFSLKANSYIEGKRCAILCVDELQKECTLHRPSPETRFDYWQEVKEHLKNM